MERTRRHARRFAEGLSAAGYEVLNDVVLNQVVVTFGDAEKTARVVAAIQADGTCWAGRRCGRGGGGCGLGGRGGGRRERVGGGG